jgi:hypothetical protein
VGSKTLGVPGVASTTRAPHHGPVHLILPADPLSPRSPEAAFARELDAARRVDATLGLLDFDALVRGETRAAVRRIPAGNGEEAIYRGWMMHPPVYRELHRALLDRGWALVNDPDAYAETHLLPNWCDALADSTPRSVIRPGADAPTKAELAELLRVFGDAPALVKDFVKSRKHEWAEACFIPRASDTDAAARVVERFLELQGEDLEGGLVFRAFEPLVSIGEHPKSGMPLARESRLFFFDGEPVGVSPYWDEVDDAGVTLDLAAVSALARRLGSRFFTFDVAERATGGWLVIEAGDGGVSGLPAHADADAFYTALATRMRGRAESRGDRGFQ